ncbi:MAG: LLM class flavin-dependent oxidoreductase [Chloroflexi bacterium]|nr:LLM class flavin-dependent oxidoreductase [Chloroflexota bacterium]
MLSVSFGITFVPGHPREFIEWCQTAEACGLQRIGIADSQSVYRELYVSCALCATHTKTIKFGPRVTNPMTRHPAVTASAMQTLQEMAPGRTFLGIATGDSAVLNAGLPFATHARLREYIGAVRDLWSRGETEYQGRMARLTWGRQPMPIYVAAHGPKTLRLAGQIADGVVVGTGLGEDVVRETLAAIRQGAEEAGRDFRTIDVWWLLLGNLAASKRQAIDDLRMSLAGFAHILARFHTQGKQIPPEIEKPLVQVARRYDVSEHVMPGAGRRNAALVDEYGVKEYLAERYALAGTPEDCIQKVRQAAAWGVRQIWMSVHFPDKVSFVKRWGQEVMPYL